MISLEQFINNNTGKFVGVPWSSNLDGQCVSLVQQYISQCLGQPMKARGNAKDWSTTYVNEGLGTIVNDLQKGDLLVWGAEEGDGYGHIAIYYQNNQIFEQNYPWGSPAHLGNIFGNYTILRPNTKLVDNYVGTPTTRDITQNQLQVNVYNLICRTSPSLSGNKLGWINEGIYNILSETEADGYTWYQVESEKWIPNKDEWCTIYPKQEQPANDEIAKLQEQIVTLQKQNTQLTDALNRFNSYKQFKAPADALYYIKLTKDEIVMYEN